MSQMCYNNYSKEKKKTIAIIIVKEITAMFANHYDITVHDDNGGVVAIALRLPISAQIELKRKYDEDTRSTIFAAGHDDEKLVEILTKALNWKGNANTIKDGADLLERIIDENRLGIVARQRLMVEVGAASGIFSDSEKGIIMKRIDAMETNMLNDEATDEADEKNA